MHVLRLLLLFHLRLFLNLPLLCVLLLPADLLLCFVIVVVIICDIKQAAELAQIAINLIDSFGFYDDVLLLDVMILGHSGGLRRADSRTFINHFR